MRNYSFNWWSYLDCERWREKISRCEMLHQIFAGHSLLLTRYQLFLHNSSHTDSAAIIIFSVWRLKAFYSALVQDWFECTVNWLNFRQIELQTCRLPQHFVFPYTMLSCYSFLNGWRIYLSFLLASLWRLHCTDFLF